MALRAQGGGPGSAIPDPSEEAGAGGLGFQVPSLMCMTAGSMCTRAAGSLRTRETPDHAWAHTLLTLQKPSSIYEREDDYKRRRLNRIISPDRNDAFAMGDKTPDARVRSYADIIREQQLQREMDNTMKNIQDKARKEAEAGLAPAPAAPAQPAPAAAAAEAKRRRRWDSQDAE